MIVREMKRYVQNAVKKIPIITILGPRQSGKTTLVRSVFPKYTYINLERKDLQVAAKKDPIGFLDSIENPRVILDEVQRVPELLSYIQVVVDANKEKKFVLTGSQNFLLLERVNQSLAGRVILFELLPLSYGELRKIKYVFDYANSYILQGGYPRLYEKKSAISFNEWIPSYIQTYIERDVRQIVNIQNIEKFQRFIALCAGRVGQIVNYAQLSNLTGVNDKTIQNWLGILKACYIIYTVPPFHENMGKRVIKSPKLYFWDTAVVCNLLGIQSEQKLITHYLYGSLFENFIFNEVAKFSLNRGRKPMLYFWNERSGLEVDLLLETPSAIVPIEIKSSKTLRQDFFRNINIFKLRKGKKPITEGFAVYRGEISVNNIVSWRNLNKLLTNIYEGTL